jgi:hypothetical protein
VNQRAFFDKPRDDAAATTNRATMPPRRRTAQRCRRDNVTAHRTLFVMAGVISGID